MLKQEDFGAAIEAARIKKGVSKRDMARHFGVREPSVQGWVKTGRIAKDKLMPLFEYFSDVVGPEHWGLEPGSWAVRSPPSSYDLPPRREDLAKMSVKRERVYELVAQLSEEDLPAVDMLIRRLVKKDKPPESQ